MFKRIALALAASTLLSSSAFAVPGTLQVDGALLTVGNGPVPDGAYDLKFQLYSQEVGGAALWQESTVTVGVKAGQFHTAIGEKVPLDAKIAKGSDLWLGVSINGDGELPRRPLGSVAYALRASAADGVDCSGCIGLGQLDPAVLQGYAKSANLAKVASSGAYADLLGSPDLSVFAQVAALATVATSGKYSDLVGAPNLDVYAKANTLANVATSGKYADLINAPSLAPVATSGKYADLQGSPVQPKLGTACGSGLAVVGLAVDGSLQCGPVGYDPSQLFQFTVANDAPKVCTPQLFGSAYASAKNNSLYICNGSAWYPIAIGVVGSQATPGKSCKDILTQVPGSKDGLYYIAVSGVTTQVYCDMTSDGGGWTLIDYAYRPQTGGNDVDFLPNASAGTWDPGVRAGKATLDGTALLQTATHVALTVTNNGAVPTAGNLLSYDLAYKWAKASGYTTYSLSDAQTTCITVAVTELKAGAQFNAMTFDNRPQVSCSGHKGGTLYERQFIGFNSATCYGVCGSDPVTSNGMVVWYGDGYTPTTSGGKSDPARAASFAFWIR